MKAHFIEFDVGKKFQVNEYPNTGKPKILCLPAWTLPIENGERFLSSLSKDFHVFTLNYPGYLNSESSPKAQSLDFLASLINLVIDQIKIGEFALLGVSMGGQVVLRYTKLNNFKNKVVLIGSTAYPVINRSPKLLRCFINSKLIVSLYRRIKNIKYYFVNNAYKTAQNLTSKVRNINDFKDNYCSLTGAYDTLIAILKDYELPRSNANYYYIYGARDDYAREVRENGIENVTIIEDAGHIPYFTHYSEVVDIINKLIK